MSPLTERYLSGDGGMSFEELDARLSRIELKLGCDAQWVEMTVTDDAATTFYFRILSNGSRPQYRGATGEYWYDERENVPWVCAYRKALRQTMGPDKTGGEGC